jgi:hypothetical protein
MTVDATERLMPCCIAPATRKHLVYGSASNGSSSSLFNAADFVTSRLSFADRATFEAAPAPQGSQPYCTRCPKQPTLTYGPENALADLLALDFAQILGAPSSVWSLLKW